MTYATIHMSGVKYSGNGYCMFSYKILDEAGYVIDSGTAMTNSLSPGEKFKNEDIYVSGIEPGKAYTIQFSNYSY